jgi:hypothetical protein
MSLVPCLSFADLHPEITMDHVIVPLLKILADNAGDDEFLLTPN